jgi:hypothetical protein
LRAFPWREEESLTTGVKILRPTVDVDVSVGDLGVTTKALIDTGSPRTIFPRGIGDLVGIEFPDLKADAEKKIELMGGRWPAITRPVSLLLQPFDDMGWEAEVDFLLDDVLSFGILGYEGFLNRWAVSINGYLGYVIVEPAEDFDQRQPPEVLADLKARWPQLFPP